MARSFKSVRNFAHSLWRAWLVGDCGSNLIEYALTVIIFFLMFLGVVDFGRALYTYHFVSSAARTAARWAAVNGSTCNNDGSCVNPASANDVQNYVKSIAPTPIDTSSGGCGGSGCLLTTATWQAPQWTTASGAPCNSPLNSPGCTVKVTVSYQFTFAAPLVRVTTLPMSSTAEMVIAH